MIKANVLAEGNPEPPEVPWYFIDSPLPLKSREWLLLIGRIFLRIFSVQINCTHLFYCCSTKTTEPCSKDFLNSTTWKAVNPPAPSSRRDTAGTKIRSCPELCSCLAHMRFSIAPVMKLRSTPMNQTSYSDLLQRTEWQLRRRTILRRDGFRCRNCGAGAELEVHHRQYRRHRRSGAFVMPWKYSDELLVTLCRPCHLAGHRQYTVPVVNL